MRAFITAVAVGILLLQLSTFGVSADEIVPGKIHKYSPRDPLSPRPHQLRFEYPADGVARAEFRSEEFFAIILVSGKRCGLDEPKRREIQKMFDANKVFMNRYDCDYDDIEEAVTYSNVNPDYSFIAVHAGPHFEDAKTLLEKMKLDTIFPGANIRKMQAILVYS